MITPETATGKVCRRTAGGTSCLRKGIHWPGKGVEKVEVGGEEPPLLVLGGSGGVNIGTIVWVCMYGDFVAILIAILSLTLP